MKWKQTATLIWITLINSQNDPVYIKFQNRQTLNILFQFSSVAQLCLSLQPHELQHTRPPGVYPNSSPSSRWCHPAISSSVVPFSSSPQSLPASGSFPVSQVFSWGVQSIGSFQLRIIPSSEHPGLISFRLDWLGLLAVQGTLKSLLQTTVQKNQFFSAQLSSQSWSSIQHKYGM